VAPSIVWGLGVGLVIALADAVTVFLTARASTPEWPIAEIDIMVNVVLYTLIGFRVGKATGLVRDAAEGGVLAGILVSAIGVGFLLLLKPPVDGVESALDVVRLVAQNVALGGLIASVSGWLGSRAGQDGAGSRF
jgi:hypothetical protein